MQTLLGETPPSALFNLKSATFKKSGIDPESLTEERMLGLLVEEPRYWRRPVAVVDGELMAGTNAKKIERGVGPLMIHSACACDRGSVLRQRVLELRRYASARCRG